MIDHLALVGMVMGAAITVVALLKAHLDWAILGALAFGAAFWCWVMF